jgi:hypothetical protein
VSQSLHRSCLCCKEPFCPDARNRHHQKYCSAPACRNASKAASQRRWLDKPANRDYFRGEANVQRVRQWRKENPGYWKRSAKSSRTLQEVSITQGVEQQGLEVKKSSSALQDLLTAQVPLLAGLISQLVDSPLQEHIEQTARRLVSKGLSVLGMEPGAKPKGHHENQETRNLSATGATGPPAV